MIMAWIQDSETKDLYQVPISEATIDSGLATLGETRQRLFQTISRVQFVELTGTDLTNYHLEWGHLNWPMLHNLSLNDLDQLESPLRFILAGDWARMYIASLLPAGVQ